MAQLKVDKISLEGQKSKAEVDDKEFRVSELKGKARELEIKLDAEEQKLSKLLADKGERKKQLDQYSHERYEINTKLDGIRKELAKIESNLEVLASKKHSYEGLFEGVKTVLENRSVLPGIIGTVQELVQVNEDHKVAVATALQNAFQNIVAKTAMDVKKAIDFLKTNKAGSATFLPLDTIKPNFIPNEMRFAIQKSAGFIGFGNEVVKIDKKYQTVLDFLLATNVIVKTYEEALEIAKLTNYRYHIITLEGERIAPYGAITGGSKKNRNNLFSESNKIKELENKKVQLDSEETKLVAEVSSISEQIELYREASSEIQSAIGASKQASDQIERELKEVKAEFQILTGKELDGEEQSFKSIDEQIIAVIKQISAKETTKEEIDQKMNVLRSLKEGSSEKVTKLNLSISEDRRMAQALKDEYGKLNTNAVLLTEKQRSASERLVQNYNLTFEAANQLEQANVDNEQETRERINILRNEIKALGNVNVEAIAEYEEENERYQNYVTQSGDVVAAIKNLKTVITDMDVEMVEQFKKIIKDVNQALPNTFATLFSGGTASIIYTNPDDILNSGIDIKISPPGKKISNLNLLSGGEKSMVALSVLFSILKVKPIPLVILDEVEAPLDIANVERFAKYLKSFTKETQFMIVTHRMGTMENCDILFGATMQQKGVTKLVQVKLIEAKKMTNAN
ncbi:AAA family ATPase [Spiroplasma clarkii]|uniref:AAA family ATPase n=1 Tax=Spiroplasma clarkii TaxID=2139 RepID=UPI001649D108|nr:AAA family ATPase [Spiroplasma clarkii]